MAEPAMVSPKQQSMPDFGSRQSSEVLSLKREHFTKLVKSAGVFFGRR